MSNPVRYLGKEYSITEKFSDSQNFLRGDDSDIFISDDWSRAEKIERHMPKLWRWKELVIFDASVEIQVDHKEFSGSHSGYESRMPGSRIWSRPRSQISMSPRRGNLLFLDKILT